MLHLHGLYYTEYISHSQIMVLELTTFTYWVYPDQQEEGLFELDSDGD